MMAYDYERESKNSVGFVLSYPRKKNIDSIDEVTRTQLNKLLSRLHRKYPKKFPYSHYSYYKILYSYDEKNIDKIKNEIKGLNMVICFGMKGFELIKKVKTDFDMNINIIKTKNLSFQFSRHIKTLNQPITKRVRTNFEILSQFNFLDKQLSDMKK